jgi:hypothetical protein
MVVRAIDEPIASSDASEAKPSTPRRLRFDRVDLGGAAHADRHVATRQSPRFVSVIASSRSFPPTRSVTVQLDLSEYGAAALEVIAMMAAAPRCGTQAQRFTSSFLPDIARRATRASRCRSAREQDGRTAALAYEKK